MTPDGPDFSEAVPVIRSTADTGSQEFAENRREMEAAVGELRRREALVRKGGGEAAVERIIERNRLTVAADRRRRA